MAFAAFSSSHSTSSIFPDSVAQAARPWLAPLAHWLQRRTSRRMSAARLQPQAAQHGTQSSLAVPLARKPAPPLRVLRVVDGSSRHCAGRMVISGRMADVCAELDRLAAREAQRGFEGFERNERRTTVN